MTIVDALLQFFTNDIDDRGTPYRHCRGCDDKRLAHTCQLCQRCLAVDHTHYTCELDPV